MGTRILGVGQPFAGDDGVGIAVLEELRRRALPTGLQLIAIADLLGLLPHLESGDRIVLVDAVLGAEPGRVLELDPRALSAANSASSHGLGVAHALDLARALTPNRALPAVKIVAVTISRATRYRIGLSPGVAAAVCQAADEVLRCAL